METMKTRKCLVFVPALGLVSAVLFIVALNGLQHHSQASRQFLLLVLLALRDHGLEHRVDVLVGIE